LEAIIEQIGMQCYRNSNDLHEMGKDRRWLLFHIANP